MTTLTTHDGRPARFRVTYADGAPICGDDRDTLFATEDEAGEFVAEAERQSADAGNPSEFRIVLIA